MKVESKSGRSAQSSSSGSAVRVARVPGPTSSRALGDLAIDQRRRGSCARVAATR